MISFYIDLHLHLDGSLPIETIIYLAKKQKISLPAYDKESLLPYISAPKSCHNLNDYLRCFNFPLQLLQTEDAISYAVYTLLKTLKEQQVLYVEIRFAPQLHLKKGLSQTQVVQAACKGLNAGKYLGIKAQLILCCMRIPEPQTENFKTLQVAATFRDQGVCAIDLAGAEALYPTRNFQYLFREAQNLELPFTIHAGEAAGAESIQAALEAGAQRIGHGIRCLEDPIVLQLLKQHQIPLEICPKSNLDTKAIVGGIKNYPFIQLLQQGLNVTINTDNMTVSQTTLAQEFAFLRKEFSLTLEQEMNLLKNSAFAAFLPDSEKKQLWNKILKAFKTLSVK